MKREFSHFELKRLRHDLKQSLSQMADMFRLSGTNKADVFRDMENGKRELSGPIQVAALYIQQGTPTSEMDTLLPLYMICDDLKGEINQTWVLRTRFPRFMAIVTNARADGIISCSADGLEWLSVPLWIDEPFNDELARTVVDEAAVYFSKYTDESLAGDF